MKSKLFQFSAVAAALLLCSCAATSLQTTWKAPDYKSGPVGTVALLAVDDRPTVREILEGQFAKQIRDAGNSAVQSRDLLTLADIKADKEAAGARFRQAGADTILVVRLVDSQTRAQLVQESTRYTGVTTGFGTDYWYGYWGNYCTVAFMDMGTTRTSVRHELYLDNSLFDLRSGKRIWTGLTETSFKDDQDRLELVKPLVATVIGGMRKDGMIR